MSYNINIPKKLLIFSKQVKNITFKISFALMALAILVLSLRYPNGVSAQYNQPTVKKTISVDKKVRALPGTTFFDNIDSSQKVFYNGDLIEFSIRIENTGDQELTQIQAEDTMPKFLDLVFNPGTYNKSSNTISWKIDSLKPAESKTFLIRAKVASVATDSAQTKLTNLVEVQANGVNDKDNASYFIGKGSIPKTGDNTLLIKTAAVLATIAGAFALRKFARGY